MQTFFTCVGFLDMAQGSSLINIEPSLLTSSMTGNDKKSRGNRPENSFTGHAQRILDTIKNSPYFLRKRVQEEPQVEHINIPATKETKFYVLYKGKVQVRGARIHDAINGIAQLVTDPTLYAPTCRTEKGENIHDNYASELSTVTVSKTDIFVNGNGVHVRLPLMDLAFCATDLRVPQVVSIVTNTGSDFFCYALVCPNRVKSNELVNTINQTFETVWKEWKRRERQETQKEDEKKVEAEMEYVERKKRGKDKRNGEKNKKKTSSNT